MSAPHQKLMRFPLQGFLLGARTSRPLLVNVPVALNLGMYMRKGDPCLLLLDVKYKSAASRVDSKLFSHKECAGGLVMSLPKLFHDPVILGALRKKGRGFTCC